MHLKPSSYITIKMGYIKRYKSITIDAIVFFKIKFSLIIKLKIIKNIIQS